MKIKVSKDQIRDAVKLVASAADKRGGVPILSNVLLEAEENLLRLTATNLDVGISTVVDCQALECGKTTVNANKAAKLFSSITGEEIDLSYDGSRLVVSTVNSRFNLSTLPAEEFPEVELPAEFPVSIPSQEIDKAIKKVAYAASRDEARYLLTGVLLRSLGDRIHAVATDGHRLALYEIFTPAEGIDSIIPKKSLVELKKLLRESEEVNLVESGNKLYFRTGDTVMWSSLIEGDYPDYQTVIPETNSKVMTAGREELLSALKEVEVIFDKEEVRGANFTLTKGSRNITAKKFEGDTAEEAEVTVPVDYEGEDFTISFNITHLIESVSSFDGESLSFAMEEPLSPVLITSREEENLKNVIMPMDFKA